MVLGETDTYLESSCIISVETLASSASNELSVEVQKLCTPRDLWAQTSRVRTGSHQLAFLGKEIDRRCSVAQSAENANWAETSPLFVPSLGSRARPRPLNCKTTSVRNEGNCGPRSSWLYGLGVLEA